MKADYTQQPSLRQRQNDATRDQIVAMAMQLLKEKGSLSHEAIAAASGMSARTVYRHFPTQDDLIAATWVQLKADTDTRFPASENEIVPLAAQLYRNFHLHEPLVRAVLFSGAGAKVRDQGAVEGRVTFDAALRSAVSHLSPQKRKRITAVFLALYSAPAWQLMRDRGQLSSEESVHAIEWALTTLLKALHNEKKD